MMYDGDNDIKIITYHDIWIVWYFKCKQQIFGSDWKQKRTQSAFIDNFL